MKIIVCDDEPIARAHVAKLLQDLGHDVLAVVSSGADALEASKKSHPDVVMLDVRMPDMDGIRCAKFLNELDNPPAIVFITAYDHYAIAAFKAQAIGYLLKPASKDELVDILQKVRRLNAAQLSALRDIQHPTEINSIRKNITAKTHRGIELIPVEDIYYFLADQKYVMVRHKEGSVLIDETLKQLETDFGSAFFRIHRNSLLSLKYLEALETVGTGQYQVAIKGVDERLAVSRRHLATLREKVQNM